MVETLEDRFPALFELRRLFWPRFEHLADQAKFDQGVGGFLDNIQLPNFQQFAELAAGWTGKPVRQAERRVGDVLTPLDAAFLGGVETLVVISFDSARTQQRPSAAEMAAIRAFLDHPDHTLFVCPHHDIGNADELPEDERLARQEAEFHHHGDRAIPARQCFGDFGIALLDALGLQVRNRFGLRPAKLADGAPAPLEIAAELDQRGLMAGVTTFNLPPTCRSWNGWARASPSWTCWRASRSISTPRRIPSRPAGGAISTPCCSPAAGVFPGQLLVHDTTTFSSTVGGLESLQRFWRNVVGS